MDGGTVTILNSKHAAEQIRGDTFVMDNIRESLGIPVPRSHGFAASLPFSLNDTTAGSETELQVAVCGKKDHVDLSLHHCRFELLRKHCQAGIDRRCVETRCGRVGELSQRQFGRRMGEQLVQVSNQDPQSLRAEQFLKRISSPTGEI